jgi:hypothetical protein
MELHHPPPQVIDQVIFSRLLRDDYVEALFSLYADRLSATSDLCCYWFEKARSQIERSKCTRAGLLATQAIRGGSNRGVLERVKRSGDIFFAISDREWVIDGANVHISLIGFDDGTQNRKSLDSQPANVINSNLTHFADHTSCRRLGENLNLWCYGSQQKAKFDIPPQLAIALLVAPNPTDLPNSDVVKPSLNGIQVLRETHESYVIDFGEENRLGQAALYEKPFEYVAQTVHPGRRTHREKCQREFWWLHARPSPRYRKAIRELGRCIVTPSLSKHRVFLWLELPTLADHQLIVFLRSDDYFFGVLHSRPHELWALKLGTRLETRPRYTATTCFETFPFPRPTGSQRTAIEGSAKRLNDLRMGWLHPPQWIRTELLEFPGSINGPWSRYVHDPDDRGIGIVRYPRSVPKDAHVYDLAKRTLTNLYNERPTWLDLAHKALDEAVFNAYGWDSSMTDEQILAALLKLNLERSESCGPAGEGAETEDDPEEEQKD